MLFNSYVFICLFLPITAVGYFLVAARLGRRPALIWLVLCSLFFYGFWNPPYLILLLFSIVVNYGIGTALQFRVHGGRGAERQTGWLLAAGMAFNLGLIGFFKYFGFFATTAGTLLDKPLEIPAIVLPLAISFFTFQQITYLADSRKGLVSQHGFIEYCLFVTFFPQIIAGPIVHHSEIIPQYDRRRIFMAIPSNIVIGLCFFALGLFKKVVIADGIAGYATPVFTLAATPGAQIEFFQAWSAALTYTFQLYFDFSGYSDMAVGLARIFNIRLPYNFNSPYKAASIIEFWRRWHMTLSRFLRDYLYIPLGGSRFGPLRRYVNVFLVMLLGGLWHGAGWTFVFWGALHGIFIIINYLWQPLRMALSPKLAGWAPYRHLARAVTFLAIVVAWVFFRSENFAAATEMLRGMAGINGASLAAAQFGILGGAGDILRGLGVDMAMAPTMRLSAVAWIAVSMVIVFALPNTQEIFTQGSAAARHRPAGLLQRLAPAWRATPIMAVTVGVVLALAVAAISETSEFLYFQF